MPSKDPSWYLPLCLILGTLMACWALFLTYLVFKVLALAFGALS